MRVLIVDDHPLFREGLASVLKQWSADAGIVYASDADAGLELAREFVDLDVVLLDLNLPTLGGMAAIKRFQETRPGVPVVIVSSSEDPADVKLAIDQGARGYLSKSSSAQTIINVLTLVLAGEVFVPRFTLGALEIQSQPAQAGALTSRQVEVLMLLCEGMPNKEIGRVLGMAEKTTKNHVSAIFRALNVVNRTQAVVAARAAGLVDRA